MIIIEGFDNTGKTTIVEKIKEEMELEVVKSPGPVGYRKLFTFVDKYMSGMEKLRLKNEPPTSYPIIHDRFPLFSDQVYGPVLRGISPFSELNEGQWLFSRLTRIGPLVIYCRPHNTEEIIKFKDGRKQMDGVQEHALILLGKYDELMLRWERNTGRKLIRYAYDLDDFDEIMEYIKGGKW